MSSTLTFSSYFRAQRRKTDRSACAHLLSTFPIFKDNVYVQYCILLGDTSVSALSSFRKDPKWGVKKLRAKKMMRRRKVNKNKFLRTKVIKTVTFVIKRLVSGGYNDTCSPPATCPRSLVTSKHLLSVSVDTSLLSVSADTYSPSTNLSNLSSPSQSSSRYTRRTRWTASISRAATPATRTRTRTKGSGWTALTSGAAPSVDQNSDPDWRFIGQLHLLTSWTVFLPPQSPLVPVGWPPTVSVCPVLFPQVSSNKTPQDIYRTKNGLDMELDGIYLLCKF